MSPIRLVPPPTAFRATKQRRPRKQEGAHLDFIRSLPCVICGRSDDTHAAHIRAACPALGKRETGAGEKPSDAWTVPLCGDHHVFGQDAQHGRGELRWWIEHNINPFILALALYRASGDHETAENIIAMAGATP